MYKPTVYYCFRRAAGFYVGSDEAVLHPVMLYFLRQILNVRPVLPFPKGALLCMSSEQNFVSTRVGNLIVATIYLQLIQNRYMFRSFTVLKSHQHCVQPVASDVEVVGYL